MTDINPATPKKRSIVLTIFATVIILLSIIRLLGTGSIGAGFSFLAKSSLVLIVIYSILSNIGNIIAATNVYKLREWARKAIIILTATQLIYMLFISIPLSNKSMQVLKTSPGAREKLSAGFDTIPDDVKVQKNITRESYDRLVFKKIAQTENLIRVISVIFLLLVILIFTRSKVKDQFIS